MSSPSTWCVCQTSVWIVYTTERHGLGMKGGNAAQLHTSIVFIRKVLKSQTEMRIYTRVQYKPAHSWIE